MSVVHNVDPFIVEIDGWLSEKDLNYILSRNFKFVPGLSLGKDYEKVLDKVFRTCYNYRIEYGVDPYFDSLTRRVADFFNVDDVECVEPFVHVKYEKDHFVDDHTDIFPGFPTNRVSTMIMYLNDDFEGGSTYFPDLDLRITPKAGNSLAFFYDKNTPLIHRGETVTSGTKYIISAFVRDGKFTAEDRKSVSY